MGDRQRERLTLFQGALTYEDPRFAGYDAAVLMEVIEHVDPPRLAALERVVFGRARPGLVVVTTPNVEYNALYEGLTGCGTPTTGSSGPAPSSRPGPSGSRRRTATGSTIAASATSTATTASPPRWGCSRRD